ncbi:MAG: hypothetical protein NW201_15550 [Gemmatimonadales bacterium]|nr:hypothetical protein [Gemmatimonadales bacterium]
MKVTLFSPGHETMLFVAPGICTTLHPIYPGEGTMKKALVVLALFAAACGGEKKEEAAPAPEAAAPAPAPATTDSAAAAPAPAADTAKKM